MRRFYITALFLTALFSSLKIIAQVACHASFYIDSPACTPFNLVFVNNSTFVPSPTPPDSVVYLWTWNDGTSSTSKYPSHTYTSPGMHHIKLDIDNVNKTCHDSLTLFITLDTLGGFHKTNAAYNFNIKVVAPKSTGISVKQNDKFVTLSSVVISDQAQLNFSDLYKDAIIGANVYSYDGKTVLSVNKKLNDNSLLLQTSPLKSGMYFVIITSGNNISLIKFIKL